MDYADKKEVEWLGIDDLRLRDFNNGAARFTRREGIWFGVNEFYFACTNDGSKETGDTVAITGPWDTIS